MIEATEDTVISGLHALASYGTIATRETWKALSTPENVPIFLSSLIKFSLGPTLAFLLSFWTFNHQENVKREKEAEKETKEAEAVRLMTELEIEQNLAMLEGIMDGLRYNLLCLDKEFHRRELASDESFFGGVLVEDVLEDDCGMGDDPYRLPIVQPAFERTVYDTQIGKLSTAYRNQPDKLSQVIRHYHYLSAFSRRFARYSNMAGQRTGNEGLLKDIQQYLANEAHSFRNPT